MAARSIRSFDRLTEPEKKMYQKRALVVGATGIVGLNVAERLVELGGWEIHGVSRRPPVGTSWMEVHKTDLLDRESALAALAKLRPTHIYYCTWTLGETEEDNIRLNAGMLRTVLDAFANEKCIEHVAVVTGTKHYLGPFEDYAKNTPTTPFREDAPRLPKMNFYYALEDVVMSYGARLGYSWSVHRSHTIIGYAVGNLMNIGATLATYASICKATGQPFVFPGHPMAWNGLNDITDATLLAKQIVWASVTPNAKNEAFNTANGDVFRWKQLWESIATYFGIEVGDYPDTYNSLAERMKNMGADWDKLVDAHGLQRNTLSQLASPWHTDLDLGRPMECINSMNKSRAFGFTDFQDTTQSFIRVFDRLRRERIIP
jgi:nucleoside-diphosphate-sugar epimerase